jgi:hypothetical protein
MNASRLTDTDLLLVLLVGMSFCAIACAVVAVPPLWRLVQARRAQEAAWDAEVFEGMTPTFDQLAAEHDHFSQWDSEMRADR